MGQQQEKRQRDAGQRGDEAGSDPAVAQRGFPLFVGTRQQDREDVQHDDAARVDQQLHGSEKRVVELKIDAGRREQHEQQVCGRTQNPLGRDGQNREDEDHRGEKGETGLL